jgi:hypothetical protein
MLFIYPPNPTTWIVWLSACSLTPAFRVGGLRLLPHGDQPTACLDESMPLAVRCPGERTLKYVPAKQPLPGARASRCACAQCAGEGTQCCLNCLGEGNTLPDSPDLWLPSEQQP